MQYSFCQPDKYFEYESEIQQNIHILKEKIYNINSLKKFDKELKYINIWVKNLNELTYPNKIVNHKEARERCLETYKSALNN